MPRNPTTGVYEAPDNSWNPAVAGTVIDPDDWNSTLADVEATLSTDNQWVFTGPGPGAAAIVVRSLAPWIKFEETSGPADFDLIVDSGSFTIRVDGGFPAPFSIDATNNNRVTVQGTSVPDDFATFSVVRTASHSGGGNGLNSAAHIRSTISAGNLNYESALTCVVDSYAIDTDPGNHTGVYIKARKYDTGMLWSIATDTEDHTVNPTLPTVGAEFALNANGTDNNDCRVILNLAGGQLDKSGAQSVVSRALLICTQFEGTDDNTLFKRGISFGRGNYETLIGFDFAAVPTTAANGIDFRNITFSDAPFRSNGFAVTATGSIIGTDISAGASSAITWAGRSRMRSPVDGAIVFSNAAENDFGTLRFGGSTSGFPAIKRVGAGLAARLADDSADTTISAAAFIPSGSTVPTNGMFLSGANILGRAVNSTQMEWLTANGHGIGAAPGSGIQYQATSSSSAQIRALTNGGGNVDFRMVAQDGAGGNAIFGTYSNHPFVLFSNGVGVGRFSSNGLRVLENLAVPSGGTTGAGVSLSATANLGIFFGSGTPSLSAAQGSLYLRTDGTANNRLYINTNGATGWTAFNTAS